MGEGVQFITAYEDETLKIDYLRTKGLPVRITDVYRAANGMGYIFSVSIRGYGREDLKLLCGIDMDGKIIETTPDALVITHTETQSFFNRVFSDRHLEQFWGADINSVEEVDAITGATITSNALKYAMSYALRAFEIVTAEQGVYNE
jgi:electron transport complex protein RnfG